MRKEAGWGRRGFFRFSPSRWSCLQSSSLRCCQVRGSVIPTLHAIAKFANFSVPWNFVPHPSSNWTPLGTPCFEGPTNLGSSMWPTVCLACLCGGAEGEGGMDSLSPAKKRNALRTESHVNGVDGGGSATDMACGMMILQAHAFRSPTPRMRPPRKEWELTRGLALPPIPWPPRRPL